MFLAGYTFHVLNNAFMSHWGFAQRGSTPEWRVREIQSNQVKFKSFAKEVSARYGRNDPFGIVAKFLEPSANVSGIVMMFDGKSPQEWTVSRNLTMKKTFR